MIKDREVIIPAQTMIEKVYICDVCGKEGNDRCLGAFSECVSCSKLVCRECQVRDYSGGSDYSDKYCERCYKLRFEVYKQAWNDLKVTFDKKRQELLTKIKEESLNETRQDKETSR